MSEVEYRNPEAPPEIGDLVIASWSDPGPSGWTRSDGGLYWRAWTGHESWPVPEPWAIARAAFGLPDPTEALRAHLATHPDGRTAT